MAVDLPTPQDLAQVGAAAFRSALDPAGTGAVNLRAGSRNDTAISVMAAMTNRVSIYAADRAAAARIGSAQGEDLDVLAQDLFLDRRKQAAAATTTVYLTRPDGTTPSSIPAGSRFAVPASGASPAVVFASTDVVAAVSHAGAQKIAVPVQAVNTGRAGNVIQSSITAILDTMPDSTWAIYVPAPSDIFYPPDTCSGGDEAEQDDQLRSRLRSVSPDQSRRRGTRDAVLFGALATPGVLYATVVEPGDGTLIVYAGDATYGMSSGLNAAVALELDVWRPFGVPLMLRAYNAVHVQATINIYMQRQLSAYDTATIVRDAKSFVENYFNTRARPDEYFISAIESACFRANQEVQNVTVLVPSTGLPMADQLRPADSGYGIVTLLNRYFVDDASLVVTVLPPVTS
jgi:hypothetical protein